MAGIAKDLDGNNLPKVDCYEKQMIYSPLLKKTTAGMQEVA
jgi:hypothetical protein